MVLGYGLVAAAGLDGVGVGVAGGAAVAGARSGGGG